VNRALLMVAVLILALLAIIYYLVDIRGRDTTEQEETAVRRLVADFDPLAVRALIIEPAGGGQLRLARVSSDADFSVEAPQSAKADPDVVQRLLGTLGRISVQDEPFPPGEDGLAPYGLSPPTLAVTVTGVQGQALARLQLGVPAPFGGAHYAAVRDTGEVGLVGDGEISAIPQSLFDVREKRLVRFHREEVRAVQLTSPGVPAVVIERQGVDWTIIEPLAFTANRELVGNLLWELTECRALEFVGEGDWAGGSRLSLTCTNGTVIGASFGEDTDEEGHILASNDSGTVMVVAADIFKSLHRPAEEWRQMRPFPRYSWEVDGLELTRVGMEPHLWMKDDNGTWPLDGEALDRALELFTGLEACGLLKTSDDLLEAARLADPAYTVTLTSGRQGEEIIEESLELGFPDQGSVLHPEACSDTGMMICGRRPGGETIYLIDEPGRGELQELLVSLTGGFPGGDEPVTKMIDFAFEDD